MNPRGTHAPQSITRSFNNLYDFYRCRMKRGGGDGLPLGGDIRRPPLTVQSCFEFPPFAYESSWYALSAIQLCFGVQRGNLEIFQGCYSIFDFALSGALKSISTKIFPLSENFDNLSLRVDLEIFAFPVDFENLSPRMDLEIFENVIRASIHEDLSQCITEEDLDQLRCRPTSFSTNYKSSTLNFDLNRGPVFWSRRRTSKVVTVVRARSKEEATCRRGPHKSWLKRATVRLLSYFRKFYRILRKWLLVVIAGPIIVGFLHGNTTGRVSRCLKPTVWTAEQSVSGVLHISSLLRSPKLPKPKGISDRGF
ncbi:LOW QUALITY PROTEIN: hypothetical protein V1477_013706 [Vespula maculifrons]|uniref:Uncharacterized protein n=1 Tax=Vespula maculifrons TaxID=7453 RepID=A0ABD2BP22_VESMC